MRPVWSKQRGARFPQLKAGDPVYAFFTLREEGGYAEFALAKENEVARKPIVDHLRAGRRSAGCRFDRMAGPGRCRKTASWSQTVLIHGGSGGVGHMAIQIAKARGARVIATASTANQDFLKKLGADQAIDYTKTKFEDVVKDVDVVLDAVGGDTLTRSYGVVKKGGIIVTIAGEPDQAALDAHGIRGVSISSAPKSETFAELTRLNRRQKADAGRDARSFRFRKWPKLKTRSRHATPAAKSCLRVAPDPKS